MTSSRPDGADPSATSDELRPASLAPVAAEIAGSGTDSAAGPVPAASLPPTGAYENPEDDADTTEDLARPTVPGYEVLGILGRGGMGVVYKARQIGLNRLVALKMIRPGAAGSGRVARFRTEAEAVARLVHANIVQVYEVGEHAGRPFLSLEFVGGGSLAARLAQTPQPARASAALIETLARAVDYAHQRGVVHRDLKPANVLLQLPETGQIADSLGIPKVADFGLAKQLDTDSQQTQSGEILGTPSYMAPEQAAGHASDIGPAVDVYALGALLYEVLTGRPPFRGPTLLDTLEQVRSQEPVPPARLQPRLPRDLDTICLKCLRKQPGARYATALDLAEDLRRFLAGEPIRARPVSPLEKVGRWCRRNPWPTLMLLLLAFFGLVAVVVPTLMAFRLNDALHESDRDRKAKERALTDTSTAFGLMASDQGEPAQAVLWFANASRLAGDDLERQRANRLRVRTWGQQLWTTVRALPHEGEEITGLAFHPGGRFLLTRARGDVCTVWDLDKETSLPLPVPPGEVTAVCWSPDGGRLVLASRSRGVEILSFPDSAVLERLTPAGTVSALAFSPDGVHLAVASKRLRLWSCTRRAWLEGEIIHPQALRGVVFAPEGGLLAAWADDDMARVFSWTCDGIGGQPLFPPVNCNTELRFLGGLLPTRFMAPVFIRSGRELVTGGDRGWQWWEARTGKLLRTVPNPAGTSPYFMALSPDGKHLALGSQAPTRLWDVVGEKMLRELPNSQLPMGAAFSPDSKKLLVGYTDRHARLWCSVPDGRLQVSLYPGEDVWQTAFSPAGNCLATALPNGLVRVWAPPEGDANDRRFAALPPWEWPHPVVSADGRHVLSFTTKTYPRPARAHELATGTPVGNALKARAHLLGGDFSPDGNHVVLLDYRYVGKESPAAGWVELWDWRSGRPVFDPIATPSKPIGAAYRPDGRQVIVLGETGWILDIDPATGKVERKLQHPTDDTVLYLHHRRLLFTADSKTFISAGCGSQVGVWDAQSGQLRYGPLKHDHGCADIEISRDDRWLLTASYDKTVRLWDLATGQPRGRPLVHPDWVFQARFSPDARYVLTACRDRQARLWDLETGEVAFPPLEHRDEVFAAAFSPDGHWIFTSSKDGQVRCWESSHGKPVTPFLQLDSTVYSLDVTPDGRYLIASSDQNHHVLDVGDLADPGLASLSAEDLGLWGELVSGQRFVEGGGATNMTAAEWSQRWREFRAGHPDYPALRAPRP